MYTVAFASHQLAVVVISKEGDLEIHTRRSHERTFENAYSLRVRWSVGPFDIKKFGDYEVTVASH